MKFGKIFGISLLTFCLLGCAACGGKGAESGDKMDSWEGGKVTEVNFAETYVQEDCRLTNPATVVQEVVSQESLDALKKGTWKPSNAILHFSKNYNILDAAGKKLDSFANIYNNILKGKIIPVLYLENDDCAEAAIAFMNERMEISDMAVMSNKADVVQKVRRAFPSIRGILAFDDAESIKGIANQANLALAHTVVLPQSVATPENVSYIQARFKTVWVKADSNDEWDLYDCIGSGAYGIIGTDFSKLYGVLGDYTKGEVRTPFNVAHRGICSTYSDNSLGGTIAATQMGATHVELDGWLSKDGHIIMMHNEGIGATANGGGNIPEMTLEEIRQYKLTQRGPVEDIPTLPEIIDALKPTDTVLVFEIKDGRNEIVDKLKEIVEEKDFADQIVVISFARNIITKMAQTLPEIPTAILSGSITASESAVMDRAVINTGIDVDYSKIDFSEELENYFKDRGMMGWYWTFGTAGQMNIAAEKGFMGLTNNAAEKFASSKAGYAVMGVKPLESYAAVSALATGDEVDLMQITYTGEKVAKKGVVRFVKDLGNRFAVVANLESGEKSLYTPRLYTQVFYIDKE